MPNKKTIIVAFGQVHAAALARSLGLADWALATGADTVRHFASQAPDIVFCEPSRRLANYDEIVTCVKAYGLATPAPLHEWGNHAATLSGAFKLLEKLQEVHGVGIYSIYAKGGRMGVYLEGLLVMHQREDGMLRFAKKGGSLLCQ